MWRLRDAQVAAFEAVREEEFRLRLREHLRRHFPAECAALGDELDEHLAKAIELARRSGLSTERDLAKYASLTLVAGLYFATDPARVWMGRMLEDEGVGSPSERLDCVHDELLRRMEAR